MKSVTLMTPIYNHGCFFSRCAYSVMSQKYTNWEWVVLNDGSTDDTEEEIKKVECEKMRYYSREHRGIFMSWVDCMELAETPLVSFMCADDTIEPDFLKIYKHVFDNEKCDVVVGDFASILENDEKRGRCFWNPKPYGWGYQGCAMLIKKQLLKDCWYKEDPPANDEGCSVWGKILLSDAKIGYVRDPLYTHIRTNNCFGAHSTNDFMNKKAGWEYIESIFSKKQLNVINYRFGKLRALYT